MPQPITSSEIMDIINTIEDRYPVSDWRVGCLHVWPLIRMRLFFETFQNSHVERAASSNVLGNVKQLLKGNLRWLRARFFERQKHARLQGPVDVLLVSDGVSCNHVGETWFERLLGPFAHYLQASGCVTQMLSMSHIYLQPCHFPPIYIQPHLDYIKVASKLSRKKELNAEHLPQLSEYLAYLQSAGLPCSLTDRQFIHAEAVRLLAISRYFKRILRKARPTVVLLSTYYSIDGMALCHASHQMNIPVIDIQHGVQGDLHPAYGRWKRFPSRGYNLLPNYFWCWSDREAQTIRRWSCDQPMLPVPIVGGDLWLGIWQSSTLPFVQFYDTSVCQKIRQLSTSQHILLTLQHGLWSSDTLSPLLAVMKNSSYDRTWWVRLHPCMQDEREQVRQVFAQEKVRNVEIDMASDFPLHAVLKHMHLHITHSSSTVIEAEAFNIPSLVISRYGAELYEHQLAKGTAVEAILAEEIEAGIKRFTVKSQPSSATGKDQDSRVPEGILCLLDLIRRSKSGEEVITLTGTDQ